ncbi:cytochrome P450 [Schizophyllum commune H4-8]|nr:cytochrome P450 [Schizophyllum commune H4-8]KAI5889190.1 cytochrome P450 [Schizophyllum commune H4-8]
MSTMVDTLPNIPFVPSLTPTSLAVAALTLAASYRIFRIASREHGLPPGPPTSPLFGNALQVPTKGTYLQFTKWAREYGEIYSIKMGSGTAIILSGPAVLKELLDKQSAYTSDRPEFSLFDVSMSVIYEAPHFNPYEKWRKLRKASQMLLAPSVVKTYQPLQEGESTQLAFDLLESPERFFDHISRYGNSLVLAILYGRRSPRIETPTALAIVEILNHWVTYLEPGATPPVDVFPIFKWIPEWMAPWVVRARKIRDMRAALYLGLFDDCRARVEAGEDKFFMGDVIRDQAGHGLTREQMSELAGAIYEAGSETTSSTLQTMVLLFAAFPEVQARLQQEIDTVVGEGRLPEAKDAEHLPYLNAVIQETHRFHTVTPLAIPHRATKDLHYKGYLIPEGATIFGNIYGLFHDPDLFENPYTFNPDRYMLTEHGTKPGVDDSAFRNTLIFGFGRRICPGMHLANVSVALAAMKLLWTFEFRPLTDPETGKPIQLDTMKKRDGIAAGPPLFKCDIRCRSSARAELLRHAFKVDAASALAGYEYNLSEGDREWLSSVRSG